MISGARKSVHDCTFNYLFKSENQIGSQQKIDGTKCCRNKEAFMPNEDRNYSEDYERNGGPRGS